MNSLMVVGADGERAIAPTAYEFVLAGKAIGLLSYWVFLDSIISAPLNNRSTGRGQSIVGTEGEVGHPHGTGTGVEAPARRRAAAASTPTLKY